ncbi:MAG: hypothetical protein A3B31_03795, partial [Candidatus Komeilibacteria bacterium RIFCSPLOWO2_01_FULL_53_11]
EIVVGRDARESGDTLTTEVIKGLREGGLDIAYVGLVSTPTFYFAVAKYGYAGGLMVSASHNPAEYNGFKLVRARAVPVGGETGIKDIEAMVLAGVYPQSDRRGTLSEKKGVLEDQVEHDLRFADVKKIKPLKIVADAANGMGALYLDELFKHLPCELVKMYFDLDGRFPNHEADPLKEENKEALKKRVVAEKADLGIATDGDGDRIFFVDDKGESIDPAILRGIMARIFLREKPGATIAYDIRPGKITKDMIEENGGKPLVTRVGHSLIKQAVIEQDAYFAGESSGHFFLSLDHGVYEVPMIVTLKLLQELSVSSMSASEYIRPLKRYAHSGEINTRVRNVAETIEAVAKEYSDGAQSRLDGITVEYADFWFNVRGSNTEPLIRLNLEAKSKEVMEQKRDEVLSVIYSFEQ